jgi:hypothetical protein
MLSTPLVCTSAHVAQGTVYAAQLEKSGKVLCIPVEFKLTQEVASVVIKWNLLMTLSVFLHILEFRRVPDQNFPV